MSLDQHITWLEQRGLRATTIYTRRRFLIRLEAELGCPLAEATSDGLAAWRAGLQLTPSSVAAYVSHVRSFYRWLIWAGLRADDPSERLVVPRRTRRLPRPISEDALALALAASAPRVRPWLHLAAYAGLRAQEIAFLQAGDIVLSGPSPHVVVSEHGGKGGKARVVPIGQKVVTELRVAGVPARGYVFPRHDGRAGPNAPWLISRLCNLFLHGLGIEHTLHSLRHRYGTMLYAVSHDLRMVQELMGHSNPSTTSGYVAYSPASAIEAVRALDVA